MGTNRTAYLETWLSVFPRPASPAALAAENSRVLLLMQPLEEFLETSVRQDCFHRTEGVPQLVMTPSLVDKSSQEWHVGTISVPPLQRGTT